MSALLDHIEVSGHGKAAREFPFRPFLTVSAVRAMMPGKTERDIQRLIDDGSLAFVFNISANDSHRSREIRILPAALDFYQRHVTSRLMDWEWSSVCREILNGYKEDTLTGTQARLLLNCGSDQIGRLTPRYLELAPGSKISRGSKGSPLILVRSLLKFLETRRVF